MPRVFAACYRGGTVASGAHLQMTLRYLCCLIFYQEAQQLIEPMVQSSSCCARQGLLPMLARLL